MIDIPDNYKEVYSPADIKDAVSRLGEKIFKWSEEVYKKTGDDVVVVPIMRGAIFFFTDLVREIGRSVYVAPVKASNYNPDTNEVLRIAEISIDGIPAKGKSILLLDDVFDSGVTLSQLTAKLLQAGAGEVKSAVLIMRETGDKKFTPDYIGFHYHGPEWFVGYGLDDKERYRNLPGVHVMIQE